MKNKDQIYVIKICYNYWVDVKVRPTFAMPSSAKKRDKLQHY